MRFFLFLVFSLLLAFPQFSAAAGDCPKGKEMDTFKNLIEAHSSFRVTHGGAYVDTVYWFSEPLERREQLAVVLAMYHQCQVLKTPVWASRIDIFEINSGRKIAKLGIWSGYKEY